MERSVLRSIKRSSLTWNPIHYWPCLRQSWLVTLGIRRQTFANHHEAASSCAASYRHSPSKFLQLQLEPKKYHETQCAGCKSDVLGLRHATRWLMVTAEQWWLDINWQHKSAHSWTAWYIAQGHNINSELRAFTNHWYNHEIPPWLHSMYPIAPQVEMAQGDFSQES